jgi:enoyl-CoA hydratase
MEYSNLTLKIDDEIALLTISRPEKLNALNRQTLEDLNRALDEIEQSQHCRAIILTGAGEKAFVAGADISEIAALDQKAGQEYAQFGQKIFSRIEHGSVPAIAAVNGYALGGGCELALACHLRFASETARFGQPEVNLGVIPGFGGTQRLPRLVGKSRALELCMSGKIIDAQEAKRIGLVDRIVPGPELINEAEQFMRLIVSKAPLAVNYVINSINEGLNTSLQEALQIEASYFGKSCATKDKTEGTTAFLAKRAPKFSGS